MKNAVPEVVEAFGDEWAWFDQSAISTEELGKMFDNYFNIFPGGKLPADAVGFDLGCGSGRWAKMIAPRVGKLHLIDPSEKALLVAKRNLENVGNCQFHLAGVDEIPLEDESCDFGYSIGVLHHVPDTEAGLRACTSKLKRGAPFLLYLYYRFDNRPLWFKLIWRASDVVRRVVSRMPRSLRLGTSQILAATVYFPLAKTAKILEKGGFEVEKFPLSQYRNSSFYVMQTDALDRFGTRLEKRFTQEEIQNMMERAGLENITFSKTSFWTAVGYKK